MRKNLQGEGNYLAGIPFTGSKKMTATNCKIRQKEENK
jgi:hypothetical protein